MDLLIWAQPIPLSGYLEGKMSASHAWTTDEHMANFLIKIIASPFGTPERLNENKGHLIDISKKLSGAKVSTNIWHVHHGFFKVIQ